MTKQRRSGGLVKVGDLLTPTERVGVAPIETKNAATLPALSNTEFENRQLNLFQNFLCNTNEERGRLSNVIDLWDSVPRYSISRQAMGKVRINGRFLERHETQFQHKGHTYTRTISPARVVDLDGIERDYYPSATEEIIEDALRKLAIEQYAGFFDKPNYRSGVVFSLYALRQELKDRGHARSYQEIVLSLNILSGSVIEITADGAEKGQAMTRSTYLPSVVAVSRARLRDDPQAKWAVQFHPLVTGSIDQVAYRQFNYKLMMGHSTQLARWLHKQLVLKYTFADHFTPFEIRFSTIKRDSGLLTSYARLRDAIEVLEAAFDELKGNPKKDGLISSCTRTNVTGPRGKLLDAVFKILPSFDFVRDTKAANKRINASLRNEAGIR